MTPASTVSSGNVPLRAGSVPYLNVAPLVRGLEGRLRWLPPSELAIALARGEIDAGLLSVTEVLRNDDYDILDGPCVSSDGEVLSVFLAHRKPIEAAHEIHCHAASLTSVQLLRVLLAERGIRPGFVPLPSVEDAQRLDFVLLIGNPALEFRRSQHAHALWDLGAAWRELTRLPFVYAVWALRRAADTAVLRGELLDAAERGRRDLDAIIGSEAVFDEAFRRAYLTRHIRHQLGPQEKAGIARFLELMRRHIGGTLFEPRYVGR